MRRCAVDYPIIIDGRQQGRLRVFRQGLYTVYSARCCPLPGLVRLSVYGQGKEGVLGLMQPCSQGLFLERRLSREAQRDFPQKIELVTRSGEKGQSKSPPLTWQRCADGTLRACDGHRTLIAFPASLRSRRFSRLRLRRIENREYLVFYY